MSAGQEIKYRPETIKAQDQDPHPGLGLRTWSGRRESTSHYQLGDPTDPS